MPGNNQECYCGNWKNQNAKQCWECGNEARRKALMGHPVSQETRLKMQEAGRLQTDRFDLAAFMRGKPAHNAVAVGHERVSNGHMQVKCADGKFRYRARVLWEEANGPIPPGRLIHHINEDPFDDRLDNFQLVTRSEHMRIHSTTEKMREKGAKGLASRYRH
jgi:hypothetical protein